MDAAVFLIVLASAVMLAGWNVMLKGAADPLRALVAANAGAGTIALPFALALGPPAPAVWPWVAASVCLHTCYYALLVSAYRRTDLGVAYPIARGSALLLATAVSVLGLHEPIGIAGWSGVVLLTGAVAMMSWHRPKDGSTGLAAVPMALGAGLAIAAYTVIDGVAARLDGSANAYTAWLFVADGLVITTLAVAWKKRAVRPTPREALRIGFGGGFMVLASYWLSVWAMTQAPIGLVTAVRESSVLFSAALSVAVLREPLRAERVAAALLVLGGLALIRLA